MARPPINAETTAKTLAIGAAGGVVFWLFGMPLAFLSGSAAAVAGAALAGYKVGVNEDLREFFIVLLGLTLGATVTPDTLALLPRWPVTLAGLAAAMLSIMWSGAFYLERVHGLDRATARLSSMPGALNGASDMPKPGKSGAITVRSRPISRAKASYRYPEPGQECSSNSGLRFSSGPAWR